MSLGPAQAARIGEGLAALAAGAGGLSPGAAVRAGLGLEAAQGRSHHLLADDVQDRAQVGHAAAQPGQGRPDLPVVHPHFESDTGAGHQAVSVTARTASPAATTWG